MNPDATRINLVLSQEQHAALKRMARERNVSVQSLIRNGVVAMTGVRDTVRYRRRPADPVT